MNQRAEIEPDHTCEDVKCTLDQVWALYKLGDIDKSIYEQCWEEVDYGIDQFTMHIHRFVSEAISTKKKLSKKGQEIVDEMQLEFK